MHGVSVCIDSIPGALIAGYPSRTQRKPDLIHGVSETQDLVNVEQVTFSEPSCELIEECVRNGEFVEARSIYEALR